jgi:hypothetical protein
MGLQYGSKLASDRADHVGALPLFSHQVLYVISLCFINIFQINFYFTSKIL